ncbi:MAG TPA: CPBP family intramembrane glutamic endopeptidase [Candidatus Dormibacteraeota bacterium]|nr:CPBP family intramembrane glutamic endopeptidase [Candidatus Dormibacteraeota bacterium]
MSAAAGAVTLAAQRLRLGRVPVLLLTLATATLGRVAVGAPAPAASAPAALLFSAVLIGGAAVSRPDLGRASWRGVALGVGGGVALVAVSLVGLPALVLGPRAASATLLWWAPLVSLVAVGEELLLRGALFSALRGEHGDIVAVAATSVLFAVIHLPLYGLGAMPIDLCAGVFLGSLRVVSGGVAAPAVAHVIADLASGWIA